MLSLLYVIIFPPTRRENTTNPGEKKSISASEEFSVDADALHIADGLCAMTISTLGLSDTADWWQIWSAAVQLNGVCVRAGKRGTNPALGEFVRSFLYSLIFYSC